MAKKKNEAKELKEVSRQEINGVIIIKFEDGSVKIIPAPIMLTADQAESLFGSDEDEEEDEEEDSDDEEEEDEDSDDDEEEDDSDEDEDGDDDEDSDDEDEEEEEEEELTPEALMDKDFEELEDLCDEKDLDTDPDDYDEDDVDGLRKAIAKELGIKLPKAPAKKKGKK